MPNWSKRKTLLGAASQPTGESSCWHFDCLTNDMIALLLILSLMAIGMFIAFAAAATAPMGYEDEAGFHFGPDHSSTQEELVWGIRQPQHA